MYPYAIILLSAAFTTASEAAPMIVAALRANPKENETNEHNRKEKDHKFNVRFVVALSAL
jgi:hypothetical protein